ncbi:MAG TPA: helix-hairpin-helix domain-containing protein [Solimonas sp.]|nr:helix-hairpin-helix domain-containing protein [Solimonas sp.]
MRLKYRRKLNAALLFAVTLTGLAIAQPEYLPSPTSVTVPESRIDVNTADEALLLKLGLRADEAKAVLKYREKHGPLKDGRELRQVRGLSPSTYQRIKDKVQFSTEASTESAAK